MELAIDRRLIAPLLLLSSFLFADPIPVRSSQGTTHAFLSIHDLQGRRLATGDLVQIAHGDHVTSHLIFRFRDGSIDDDTTIYTQRKTFQLVSDRHIQRGPSFPKPMDMLVEANGNVTIRDLSSGKSTTEHLDLPADTCNGLLFTVLTSLPTAAAETKVSLVAPAGKGRLVQLSIKPDGNDTYTADGLKRQADIFRIHVELGGLTGLIAPIVGKQPEDMRVWVSSGDAPTVLKGEAQLYEGGPIWRIELVSPAWPKETSIQR